MTDYTKITDFTAKDVAEALIEGQDFDNEFNAVASASATKANKVVPATANSVAGLSSTGDLRDSGITEAQLAAAIAAIEPVGTVKAYAGAGAPTGYLLCDGSSHSTASEPDLFAIIGYTFGGSGANFNVPDMRGRAIAGLDNMGGTPANVLTNAAADSMGGTLGSEYHTLTKSEMPSHTHTGTTDSAGAHVHSTNGGGTPATTGASGDNKAVLDQPGNTGSAGAHTHTFTTGATGGGAAHNNVQPTMALNFIIKK